MKLILFSVQDLAVLFDSVLCGFLQGCTASLPILQNPCVCAQTHVAPEAKMKDQKKTTANIFWTLLGLIIQRKIPP